VQGHHPGSFALVMASGIISVGMKLQGYAAVSVLLEVVAAAAFALLVVLTAWRLAAYRQAMADDLADPERAFGFFTFVAGADVLGVRLSMDGHYATAGVLLGVAGTVWLVLGYVVPWTAVLGHRDRRVLRGANGTWFVWSVAVQSVAVLSAGLEPEVSDWRDVLAVVAVAAWSVGVFLYATAGVLVALRMLLYGFGPEDLTPPYWVAMGAGAITVLAGTRITEMSDAPTVSATGALVGGASVAFWAVATWLVPALVAAGWWRHGRHGVPLAYDPTLWSMVFPLGMYAVAGIYLGQSDRLPLVDAIGGAALWLAIAVWALVLVGMVVHVTRTVVTRPARG
jgi:tellurite resistance protein TehA-like permease